MRERAEAARGAGGFTVLEVLVAMTVLVLGLAGVLAVQTAAVKGNQNSRRLDRAKLYAEQTMESLRGKSVPAIEAMAGALPDAPLGPDGVVYHRSFSVTQVAAQPGLVMVTVSVTYANDGDETDLRGTTLQLMRTRVESL